MKVNWILYGIHFLLALSTPFVLALLVGCVKIKEEQPDYGPEVPFDQVELAMSKAVHGANFDSIKVGQNLKYTINRRIENEEFLILLGGTQVEVINRQDTPDTAVFTLRITQSERISNNGDFETKVTEEPLVLQKVANSPASSNLTETMLAKPQTTASLSKTESLRTFLSAKPFTSTLERKVARTTYHRLNQFSKMQPPPKAVSDRPDCGGLNPCEMLINYIQFDMVQWLEDDGRQKISFDFAFSIAPPYLPFGQDFDQLSGVLITDCRSTYIPLEKRSVYVRDCQILEDLQK